MNTQALQKWNRVKLGDCLENIIGGGTPSKKNPSYWNGAIPWASVKDMADGQYRISYTEDFITEKGLENSASNLIKKDTVVISTRMGLGRAAMTSMDLAINQDLKALIPNEKINNRYLLWLYLSKAGEIQQLGTGATVAGIRLEDVRELEFLLPDIVTQKQIADILFVYDDLIENNTQRIQILEQIAQATYVEWFVNFRFPGHKNLKLTESGTDFGKIPKGWKVVAISEAIFINPRIKIGKTEAMPFIAMDRLSETSMVIDSNDIEYRTSGSGSKFLNGDTLFARITPCLENGKTGYVQFLKEDEVALGSTEFVVLRNKTLTPEFIYCLSRNKAFRDAAAKTMTGASGRQRVQNSFFISHKIIEPDQDCLGVFSDLIAPIFREIHALSEQINVLKSSRDLLIPKLVKGEIKI